MQKYDVAIIGGGMVGASLALSLSQSSLRMIVIDQQSLKPQPIKTNAPYSARVSALTEASTQFFSRMGAWELMQSQRVSPYRHMHVWDGEGTGEISFDAKSVGCSTLGHIVENQVIRQALLKGLVGSGVKRLDSEGSMDFRQVESGHEISFEDGSVIHTRLLVGADGAESRVRKWTGIPSSQKDCLHHAVVTTVETEQPHQGTAWQVFLDSGPLAILPLPDQNGKHYCSIVWSLLPDRADEIMLQDETAFCQTLTRAFESRLGQVVKADERFRYPLRHRHAKQYHRNGVVLVGDAAHTIHPLAGQGVNLGLQDVQALSEELLRAHHRNDEIAGDHILSRYQRRRRGANITMMAVMDGFQHLFNANDIAVRWLRNTGLNITNHSGLVKTQLVKRAMGLGS